MSIFGWVEDRVREVGDAGKRVTGNWRFDDPAEGFTRSDVGRGVVSAAQMLGLDGAMAVAQQQGLVPKEKPPELPAMPKAPDAMDPKVMAQMQQAAEQQRRSRGRASTILAGANSQGLGLQSTAPTARRYLLGA